MDFPYIIRTRMRRFAQQINWDIYPHPSHYDDVVRFGEVFLSNLAPYLKKDISATQGGTVGEEVQAGYTFEDEEPVGVDADIQDGVDIRGTLPSGGSWQLILTVKYRQDKQVGFSYEVCFKRRKEESFDCLDGISTGRLPIQSLASFAAKQLNTALQKGYVDEDEIRDYMYELLESNTEDFFTGDPSKWEIAETLALLAQEEFGLTDGISLNTLKLWAADVVEELLHG